MSPRWIYIALFFATLAIYQPVRSYEFINFDDPDYVSANPHVREGVTADSLAWDATSTDAANWFPLTRFSHSLDVQLFGMDAGWHHLINAFLHALATLFLFAFLYRATSARWPSAFVAFMFALHPLHVESVAWIAERKDVLAALFWFAGLLAYTRYVEKPSAGRYWLVVGLFTLGLLSKPMIVTFPFVLLLVDLWPLGRRLGFSLIREKVPLFALSAAAAVITYMAQSGSGAVDAMKVPLSLRMENALVSYGVYIAKMFWPSGLAVFYPYPSGIAVWQPVLALLGILALSAIVLRFLHARPYLAVGWFWYLGTLVPVIGLIQVGSQARADRYTYVPIVGLLIMLAWGAKEVVDRWPKSRVAMTAAAGALCAACMVVTSIQIQYWRNSEALFRHALDETRDNYLAHHNLGVALADDGRFRDAIEQYQASLQIEPNAANVQTDYGNALAKSGRMPEAIAHYRSALQALPDSPITHNDLAGALAASPESVPEAIAEYQTALRLKPDYVEARNNLVKVESDAAKIEYNLGVDAARSRKPEAAVTHFEEALRLKPDYVDAHNNLGVVLAGTGRVPEALSQFEAALRTDPNSFDAHVNLGIALSGMPARKLEAIQHLEAALRVRPDPEIRQLLDRIKKQP